MHFHSTAQSCVPFQISSGFASIPQSSLCTVLAMSKSWNRKSPVKQGETRWPQTSQNTHKKRKAVCCRCGPCAELVKVSTVLLHNMLKNSKAVQKKVCQQTSSLLLLIESLIQNSSLLNSPENNLLALGSWIWYQSLQPFVAAPVTTRVIKYLTWFKGSSHCYFSKIPEIIHTPVLTTLLSEVLPILSHEDAL